MEIRMSPNVAVLTDDLPGAVSFYTEVLGFKRKTVEPGMVEIDADPFTIFVSEDHELSGPIMELFVDDLEKARDELLAQECEVVRWRGKGQDCYIRDPYGVIFNLWEIGEGE